MTSTSKFQTLSDSVPSEQEHACPRVLEFGRPLNPNRPQHTPTIYIYIFDSRFGVHFIQQTRRAMVLLNSKQYSINTGEIMNLATIQQYAKSCRFFLVFTTMFCFSLDARHVHKLEDYTHVYLKCVPSGMGSGAPMKSALSSNRPGT